MLTYSMFSEIGDRNENEDSIDVCLTNERQFFFLADGLGGHGNGKIASKAAIQNGKECVAKNEEFDMIRCFGNIFSMDILNCTDFNNLVTICNL